MHMFAISKHVDVWNVVLVRTGEHLAIQHFAKYKIKTFKVYIIAFVKTKDHLTFAVEYQRTVKHKSKFTDFFSCKTKEEMRSLDQKTVNHMGQETRTGHIFVVNQ